MVKKETKNMAAEKEVLFDEVYTLERPITCGDGTTLKEIIISEPTVAQFEMATLQAKKSTDIKSDLGLTYYMLSQCSGLPLEDIKKLTMRDFLKVSKVIDGFFLELKEDVRGT
jgi:hypothetical protein